MSEIADVRVHKPTEGTGRPERGQTGRDAPEKNVSGDTERYHYPGLGTIYIQTQHIDGLPDYYLGFIHWHRSPKNLRQVIADSLDHDAVQDACEARILKGPGQP